MNKNDRKYECIYEDRIIGISEVAKITWIKKDTIYHKLIRGKTLQDIIDNPSLKKPKMYIFGKKECTINELAELAGMTRNSFLKRLNNGESISSIVSTGSKVNRKKYKYFGKLYSFSELLTLPECHINSNTLRTRLNIFNWNVEKAILTPPSKQKKEKFYLYKGKKYTLKKLIELPECKVNIHTLRARIYSGWNIEKALITKAANQTNKYFYQGKVYTLKELVKLPECKVNIHTLRRRLKNSKFNVEEAITLPPQK